MKMIRGWQPAKIALADDEGHLLISFLRCPRKYDIKLERVSQHIAPAGSYTDDFNQRFDMEVDQTFDCADEYGIWYRSTVLGKDFVPDAKDINGDSIPRMVVGFRYLDPNGQKDDDMGNKWTGWISSKFDQTLLVAQTNIQRWDALTFQYNNVGSASMVYEMGMPDQSDVIFPSRFTHEYACKRPNNFAKLQCVADIVNEFGKKGGFDLIL